MPIPVGTEIVPGSAHGLPAGEHMALAVDVIILAGHPDPGILPHVKGLSAASGAGHQLVRPEEVPVFLILDKAGLHAAGGRIAIVFLQIRLPDAEQPCGGAAGIRSGALQVAPGLGFRIIGPGAFHPEAEPVEIVFPAVQPLPDVGLGRIVVAADHEDVFCAVIAAVNGVPAIGIIGVHRVDNHVVGADASPAGTGPGRPDFGELTGLAHRGQAFLGHGHRLGIGGGPLQMRPGGHRGGDGGGELAHLRVLAGGIVDQHLGILGTDVDGIHHRIQGGILQGVLPGIGLRRGAAVADDQNVRAVGKGIRAHGGDAAGHGHVPQVRAAVEGPGRDGLHRAGHGDVIQVNAGVERVHADVGRLPRNVHLLQGNAVLEGARFDGRHLIVQNHPRQGAAVEEGVLADFQHIVQAVDLDQIFAAVERFGLNVANVVQVHRGDAQVVLEAARAHGNNLGRNGHDAVAAHVLQGRLLIVRYLKIADPAGHLVLRFRLRPRRGRFFRPGQRHTGHRQRQDEQQRDPSVLLSHRKPSLPIHVFFPVGFIL